MTALRDAAAAESVSAPLHDRAAAETYIASVCFKHGPPRLVGVELEWTVHDARDPRSALDLTRLAAALGAHAPVTVNPDSPNLPLPHGSLVTVEPGGQVEISAPPHSSLADLISTVSSDATAITDLLADHGLTLGRRGLDQARAVNRLLDTPRYAAMECAFARHGTDGITWMCASAGLQVCVDAGEPDRVAARWAALHSLGPVLSALFANSGQRRGGRSTWVSGRMRTMFGADPIRNRPSAVTSDPAAWWARKALDSPVMCVRTPTGDWTPAVRMSFAEWIDGAAPTKPTADDLDYHLSTLFPPVRPRGYLEVRYLDAQDGDGWIVPSVLLAGLMADETTVDATLAATEPAAGRWLHAARYGLADARIAASGKALVELAERVLASDTRVGADIGPALASTVVEEVAERIETGNVGGDCS
ncbi:MAG TPA: glutamate-cysteine ligase family protein [Pseudonocardiaceae bacterium]|jgi:glutamate--cysteine ligase|nr:glutamate-cysteine ligase family protein [Pseudonocardiaceae bacterium]